MSVIDLGIVRDVSERDGALEVVLTPTYSGCPATEVIERQRRSRPLRAGLGPVRVTQRLAPAWTTDWITPKGGEAARLRHRAAGAVRGRAPSRIRIRPRAASPARAAAARAPSACPRSARRRARRCTAASPASNRSNISSRSEPHATLISTRCACVASRPDTDEAMVVSFDVPPTLRDASASRQGQYLTLRSEIAGEDLRRSYSICAGIDDGELRVGVRKRARRAVLELARPSDLQRRRQHRRDAAAGPLLRAARRERRAPLPGHGRRQRHHADPLDHEDGAGARAGQPLHAGLRQPRAASTMFKEELEDLKNRYMARLVAAPRVLAASDIDSPLHSGVLDRAKLAEFLGAWSTPTDRPRLHLRPVPDERRGRGRAAGRRRAPRSASTSSASASRRAPPTRARPQARVEHERSRATRERARIVIVRDGLHARDRLRARTTPASSTPPRRPAWTCRSRASRACAAPAAPSWSKARCA